MVEKATETETENNEDTGGLKAKNAELLGKLKTATASVKTLTERLDALEQDRNDAVDSTKSEADREKTKLQRQIDKLTADLADRDTKLSTLTIDNAINEAISKHGVMPQYARAVTAMLKAEAKMENGEATAGGVPLADHITGFFKSADAQHFIAAPANSGAGAQGSSAKATAWTKAPETADEFNSYMKLAAESPEQANALAASWGRSDLKV